MFIISSPVSDFLEFLLKINESSHYPCSIIVISLGTEINTQDLELLNTGKYDEYFMKNGKQQTTQALRKNTIYINFHDLVVNNPDINSEIVIKPILKSFFKEIANQFVEYITIKNIYPIDFENLNTKSIQNYINYIRAKQMEDYTIPQYLLEEKEDLLKDIKEIGYVENDLQNAFDGHFPSFERHFVFNVMNDQKIQKNKKETSALNISKRKEIVTTKEYIIYKGKIMIDERNKINTNDKRDVISYEDLHKRTVEVEDKSELLFINSKKQVNKEICNICDERKINIAFQLCKHRYCCDFCVSDQLQNCPICNKKIKSFVRLYNI